MESQPPQEEITLLLRQMDEGNSAAADRLLPHVYRDLRELARHVFGSRREMTMQPTALVHEAYLRLVRHEGQGFNDRQHFMRVAALAMRQLLADYARSRGARKRAGNRGVSLQDADTDEPRIEFDELELIAVHEALEKLRAMNARHAEIVELRFFSGMTVEEIAGVLGLGERTVYLDWKMARHWFQHELSDTAES